MWQCGSTLHQASETKTLTNGLRSDAAIARAHVSINNSMVPRLGTRYQVKKMYYRMSELLTCARHKPCRLERKRVVWLERERTERGISDKKTLNAPSSSVPSTALPSLRARQPCDGLTVGEHLHEDPSTHGPRGRAPHQGSGSLRSFTISSEKRIKVTINITPEYMFFADHPRRSCTACLGLHTAGSMCCRSCSSTRPRRTLDGVTHTHTHTNTHQQTHTHTHTHTACCSS